MQKYCYGRQLIISAHPKDYRFKCSLVISKFFQRTFHMLSLKTRLNVLEGEFRFNDRTYKSQFIAIRGERVHISPFFYGQYGFMDMMVFA